MVRQALDMHGFGINSVIARLWVSKLIAPAYVSRDLKTISEIYIPFRIAVERQMVSTKEIIIAGVPVSIAVLWTALLQWHHQAAESRFVPM